MFQLHVYNNRKPVRCLRVPKMDTSASHHACIHSMICLSYFLFLDCSQPIIQSVFRLTFHNKISDLQCCKFEISLASLFSKIIIFIKRTGLVRLPPGSWHELLIKISGPHFIQSSRIVWSFTKFIPTYLTIYFKSPINLWTLTQSLLKLNLQWSLHAPLSDACSLSALQTRPVDLNIASVGLFLALFGESRLPLMTEK